MHKGKKIKNKRPMEKGCFWGGPANIAFCEEDRMTSPGVLNTAPNMPARNPPCQQTAYVSIRQHTSAYVSIRQHTSAYVRCVEYSTEHALHGSRPATSTAA
jgi:hypothetical protein